MFQVAEQTRNIFPSRCYDWP